MNGFEKDIFEAIEIFYEDQNELIGISFLRDAVKWLDSRPEHKNENKSPIQLLSDFARDLIGDTNEQ